MCERPPAPKKAKTDAAAPPRFLNDLLFHLHPAALSKTRRKIFERQIVAKGGRLVDNLADSKSLQAANEIINVLIDDSLVNQSRLQSIIAKCFEQFGGPGRLSLEFVALRWLSDCLKGDKLIEVDEGTYLLRKSDTKSGDDEGDGQVPSTSGGVALGSAASANKDGEGKKVVAAAAAAAASSLQQKFVCAHSSEDASAPQNHNKIITDQLEKLAQAYKNSNDTWRSFGYEKAIAAIKRHPRPISGREEAAAIRGVGHKMADKIEEILASGKLQKVGEVCGDERAVTLDLFNRIWGVGPTTAESWYTQGFRSLQDLRQKAKLSRQQQVGLRLFDDLDERMPREEAAEIEASVRDHAMRINPGLEVIACGSYRRGKATCGDLDVLVTHPDTGQLTGVFDQLLHSMRKSGFLTDDLTIQTNGNQQKYLGVCKLKTSSSQSQSSSSSGGKHRRLDIIVVPAEERATALMYFTGSAHFNRSMRLLAIKMGMSLSEHSLRRNVMRHNKEKVNAGTVLDTPTEESVFKHLGLEHRTPNQRDH